MAVGFDGRRGILITRNQAEAWAGHPLTDEQIERLETRIDNSSIPDAIATMAGSMFAGDPGWNEEE